MKKNFKSRMWYYFRMGWSTYFAFIFAAINTLTVTYYLAIEKYPQLQLIFPNFLQYVLIIVSIGVPVLVFAGYVHYKKFASFKAEADINIETNPHWRRILENTDLLITSYLKLIELNTKLLKNEKLTSDGIFELDSLKNLINQQIKRRTLVD